MVIFNIKGKAVEELPERQIEANSREEAEARYLQLFEAGEIESDQVDVVFFDDSVDEEGDDSDEEVYEDDVDEDEGREEDYEGEDSEDGEEYEDGDEDDEYEDEDDEEEDDLEDPKIHGVEIHMLPVEVWDYADHSDYYLEKGYHAVSKGSEGTDKEYHYLYKKSNIAGKTDTSTIERESTSTPTHQPQGQNLNPTNMNNQPSNQSFGNENNSGFNSERRF